MFILRVWKVHKCGNCLQSFKTSYLCLIRKTHYDTLGVQPTATQSEIRLAYLKACKKMHPDLNPNDPKSHEKFVLISTAYDILSDKSKRSRYDDMIKNPSQRKTPMHGRDTTRPHPYGHRYEYRSETKEWRTYRDFNNSTYYTRSRNSNRYTGDYTHPKANYTVFEKSSEFATISFVTIIMMFLIVHHINEVMSRDLDHQLKMGHSKQKHYRILRGKTSFMVRRKIMEEFSRGI